MYDQGSTIVCLNAALMGFTLGAVCSRLGRRVIVLRTYGYHDLMITIACICAFVFSLCQCVATSFGFGLHESDIKGGWSGKVAKLIYISNDFYFACNWFVKHALLLFYSEIVTERKYQISIYIMHFVAFGFGLSSVLVNIFQCTPIAKAYLPMEGHCVSMFNFLYFNAPMMLATDMVLYIMPVVFTWKLQLRRRQRIGVNCLFALGGLVLAASAARIRSIHYVAVKNDFPYWFANAMIWSALENHLAIFVACVPSIKVVALLVFPRLKSSYRRALSRVSFSSARRTSSANSHDLESGRRNSNNLKFHRPDIPMPSPVVTAASHRSMGFRQFLTRPTSPLNGARCPRRLPREDSMEHDLVYLPEDSASRKADVPMVTITGDSGKKSREEYDDKSPVSSCRGSGIRIERTLEMESSTRTDDDEITEIWRATLRG